MKTRSIILAGAALIVAAPALGQTVTPGAGANAGLSGTFYKVPSGSTNFTIDDTLAQLASASPSGTFTSKNLDYIGNDNSSITSFLGSDGASYMGASGTGDLSDGILEFKGYFLAPTAGTYSFYSDHDDSVQLKIGGTTVFSGNCCTFNGASSSGNVTLSSAGLYALDFIYSNTNYAGGQGGANVNLTTTGDLSGSFVQSVPEPATWAMMLLGFGLVGLGLRRRPSVRVTYA